MPYRPTGHKVGRPQSSKLVPLSVKLSPDLLVQVKRYAGLHRLSIADLVRDGLAWRITEGDPWYYRNLDETAEPQESGSQRLLEKVREIARQLASVGQLHQDERNTEIPDPWGSGSGRTVESDSDLLHELLEAQARQEARLEQLTQAFAARAVLTASPVMEGNTGHTGAVNVGSPGREGGHTGAAEHTPSVATSITSGVASTFDYDAAKYVLGKLCPRGHAHGDTGKSLLRGSNRHCLACDREKFHERKQAKRQAQPDSAKPPANEPEL